MSFVQKKFGVRFAANTPREKVEQVIQQRYANPLYDAVDPVEDAMAIDLYEGSNGDHWVHGKCAYSGATTAQLFHELYSRLVVAGGELAEFSTPAPSLVRTLGFRPNAEAQLALYERIVTDDGSVRGGFPLVSPMASGWWIAALHRAPVEARQCSRHRPRRIFRRRV
jgi:hypothetical protein